MAGKHVPQWLTRIDVDLLDLHKRDFQFSVFHTRGTECACAQYWLKLKFTDGYFAAALF